VTSDAFINLLDAFPEGWRPKSGDKLIGIVIGTGERTGTFGKYPIVDVRTDEGRDFAFHAYHTVARNEIEKLQPKVGDRIGIAYHGPHPTRGYERYRIVIIRDTGSATDDNAAPPDTGTAPDDAAARPDAARDQNTPPRDDEDDDVPF
jgi:hypothetical protein